MIDPTDIPQINALAREWAPPGSPVFPVAIDRIELLDDARDAVAEVAEAMRSEGDILLVIDDSLITRAGGDFKVEIESRLASVAPMRTVRLPLPFHADLPAAEALVPPLAGAGLLVAAGSGSVTDTAKYARALAARGGHRVPFLNVPTAASVTAYASALAVLLVDGVKRTLPAAPPEAIVADLRVLAEAPAAMTRAGFGDVLARSVSYGDWYLAAQLDMTEGFNDVASRLIAPHEAAMIEAAEAVGRAEPAAVRLIFEALLLAGMAMSLVNQTAPLSGWEHVISHLLDMTAGGDGRDYALHGEQVGVGTLIAARAYEQAWSELDLDAIAGDSPAMDRRALRERVVALFGEGPASDEVWRDAEVKLARWQAAAAARRSFVARHRSGELLAFLRGATRSAAAVEEALRRAGAPTRFSELSVPIGAESAHRAVRWGHLIRQRFTLGDLLAIGGWLTDERVTALLGEAA